MGDKDVGGAFARLGERLGRTWAFGTELRELGSLPEIPDGETRERSGAMI